MDDALVKTLFETLKKDKSLDSRRKIIKEFLETNKGDITDMLPHGVVLLPETGFSEEQAGRNSDFVVGSEYYVGEENAGTAYLLAFFRNNDEIRMMTVSSDFSISSYFLCSLNKN